MSKATDWDNAVAFFTKHAGLSYTPPQTPEEGQRIVARKLAAAEMARTEMGWTVSWSDDWEITDHVKEYDAYDAEPETCEYVVLTNKYDVTLGSLGCVDDATDDYRRVVVAELAEEGMRESKIDMVTCGTCDRMFPDLYPAARCPFEADHEPTMDEPFELTPVEEDFDDRGVAEHVFLVALSVYGDTRADAEEWLYANLPRPRRDLDCYWIAEDDRRDGSDNSSAVFVTPGRTEEARALLEAHGLTGEPDYAEWTPRARRQRADHAVYMQTH